MTRLKQIDDLTVFNIHGDLYNVGIPDLIGCYRGKFFAIELKVKKNKPTPLQTQRLLSVEKAGGIQGVAWTWGDVKKILEKCGLCIDTANMV